jgi:hypothetical protein
MMKAAYALRKYGAPIGLRRRTLLKPSCGSVGKLNDKRPKPRSAWTRDHEMCVIRFNGEDGQARFGFQRATIEAWGYVTSIYPDDSGRSRKEECSRVGTCRRPRASPLGSATQVGHACMSAQAPRDLAAHGEPSVRKPLLPRSVSYLSLFPVRQTARCCEAVSHA